MCSPQGKNENGIMARSRSLFDPAILPEGLLLQEEFLDRDEERALVERFRSLEFHDMRMRGVTARRRIIDYGWRYSFESFKVSEGPPLPDFLLPIRERAAIVAGLSSEVLTEALLTEYPPGATIGWHRDAAPFDVVVGISLVSPCRFRFRRGRTGAWQTTEVLLAPRSIYVLTSAARREWQHSIPAVSELRYSITFRTLRGRLPEGTSA
jgi:DNA oxidative demethylase